MKDKVSQPFTWLPRPPPLLPPPPLRTTASHFFFTHRMDATSGPPGKVAPAAKGSPPIQPTVVRTNVAAVTPKLGSHAALLDTDSLEVASNAPTACFLGIPTEVRYMVYEYLWTPTVNIYIMSPSLSPHKVNAIHPIFNVNRHIRSEAIDSLKRNKSLTFAFHASTDDADFRKLASVLQDLGNTSNYFKESSGGGDKKMLQVHLHLHFRDAYLQTSAPGGFEEYIACLAKLGLEAEYEYTFTDRDEHERSGDFARRMIINRIFRLIPTNPVFPHLDSVMEALSTMQYPY
ncbi:hypothetical protein Q7P36_009847 [Cladosporium allicinum]